MSRQKLTGVGAGVHQRASADLMADEKEKSTASQQYGGSALTRGLPHGGEKNGPSVPTTTDGPHRCVGCKQVDTAVHPTTSRTHQHLGSLMWTGWNSGCLGTADAPGPLASWSGP